MVLGKRSRKGFYGQRKRSRKGRIVKWQPFRLSQKGRMKRGNFFSIVRNIVPNGALQDIPVAGTHFSGAITASLDQLPDYATYQSLFDQYRIKRVQVSWRMVTNPNASAETNLTTPANSTNFYPDIYATVDHDDTNTLGSVDAALQYAKCKVGLLKPDKWFRYSCRPTANIQMYQGATSGYANATNKMWMDIANQSIPHYGIKVYIDCYNNGAQGGLTQPLYFETRYKYWVEFRNRK